MSAFALGLVLAAAFIHASWNYVLKRSGVGVAGLTGGVITAYSVWDKQAVAVALRYAILGTLREMTAFADQSSARTYL